MSPVTKLATLHRAPNPSYGSLEIPTMHPTFLSESGIRKTPTPIDGGFSISSFTFFTGPDPTQYVLSPAMRVQADLFPVEPSSMRRFVSHTISI